MYFKRAYRLLDPGVINVSIIPNVFDYRLELPGNLKKRILEELEFEEKDVLRDFLTFLPDSSLCVSVEIKHNLAEEILLQRLRDMRYEETRL